LGLRLDQTEQQIALAGLIGKLAFRVEEEGR